MELNKSVKQAFSVLQNKLTQKTDFIIITNKEIVFNDKKYVRNNNNWEEEEEVANLSNIFLKIGINDDNHNKLRLLESENNLLKKQIEEFNEKRIKK